MRLKTLRQKVIAVLLILVVGVAASFFSWHALGSPQWVAECGRYCYVSDVYGENGNEPYTVEFAGAKFMFLYSEYTGYQVWNGTTVYLTDFPDRAHFNIELSGWTAYNVTIDVGGYVGIAYSAPLILSTVEHEGRLVGMATANTYSLWGKWVFLVSV